MPDQIAGIFSFPSDIMRSLERIMDLGGLPDHYTALSFCLNIGASILAGDLNGDKVEIRRPGFPGFTPNARRRLTPEAKTRWLRSNRISIRLALPPEPAWQYLQYLGSLTGYDPPDSLDGESVAMTTCVSMMKDLLEAIKYPDARMVRITGSAKPVACEWDIFPVVRARFAEMERSAPSAPVRVLRPENPVKSGPAQETLKNHRSPKPF